MSELAFQTLDWMARNLVIPDGERSGEPFVATDDQARFAIEFYALDAAGRRKVRRAQQTWPKGKGKSPGAAALAAAEAWGPPAPPTPWVQVAGVSQDAAVNTWASLQAMIDPAQGGNVGPADIGITRINLPGGGKLEPVTASAGTRRGQRITFAVLDESSLWRRSNGGIALASTIRDNLAKMGGASIETTNAFVPGEDSVAERTFAARESQGVLVDWPLATIKVEHLHHVKRLRAALAEVYGDAAWVDLGRLVDEANDPDADEANFRRMFLNQIIAEDDHWIGLHEWAELGGGGVEAGEEVALGFDGSRFDDATALVATSIEAGVVSLLGLWEHPGGNQPWEVPSDLVEAAVERAHEVYDVTRFYCDPPYWADEVDRWQSVYGTAVRWETYRGRQMAAAVDRFETAAHTGTLIHDGGEALARHVANTRWAKTRHGKKLRKEYPKSPDKIDAAVAAVLSWEARADTLAAGRKDNTKKAGRLVLI